MEGQRVLEVLALDEAHLLQRLPEALAGGPLADARALEVGRGQELVAHQDLAEVLLRHAALRAQDVALAEADAAHLPVAGEIEDPRLAADVYGAKKRGERALGEGTLHLMIGPRRWRDSGASIDDLDRRRRRLLQFASS